MSNNKKQFDKLVMQEDNFQGSNILSGGNEFEMKSQIFLVHESSNSSNLNPDDMTRKNYIRNQYTTLQTIDRNKIVPEPKNNLIKQLITMNEKGAANQLVTSRFRIKKFTEKLTRERKNFNLLKQLHYRLIGDQSTYQYLNNDQLDQFFLKKKSIYQTFRDQFEVWFQSQKIGLQCKIFFEKIPIIQPESQTKFVWDLILTVIRIFLFFVVTIELSFQCKELYNFLLVPYIMSLILLLLDIILMFDTAYFECGQIVSKRSAIVLNYMQTHLLTDILSVTCLFAVTFIEIAKGANFIPSTQKPPREIYTFLLFSIFLQLPNIQRVLRKIEEGLHFSKQTLSLIDLIKLVVLVSCFEHIFSCIWYFVGRIYQDNNEKNWITKAEIQNEDYNKQYLFAFYYASVTMISVGYGDIVPQNNAEMVVSIIFMFGSCIQLSYSVSALFNILSQINAKNEEQRSKLRSINIYMQSKNISNQLQFKIREYLTYFWQEQNSDEEPQQQQIINQLSLQLKEDLMLEANSLVLKGCSLFSQYFSPGLKKKTIQIIKSITLVPDQKVENYNDDQLMYFIEKGKILVEYENAKKQQSDSNIHQIAMLGKGQNFGLLNFLTGEKAWEAYKSIGFTKLLYISRWEFLQILRDFPEDYEQFCMLKDSMNFKDLGIKCFSCYQYEHTIKDCPLIHYVPDREKIIKSQQYSDIQQRKKLKNARKKFTQFQSLRDIDFLNDVAEAFQYFHEPLLEKLYDDMEEENEQDLTTNISNTLASLENRLIRTSMRSRAPSIVQRLRKSSVFSKLEIIPEKEKQIKRQSPQLSNSSNSDNSQEDTPQSKFEQNSNIFQQQKLKAVVNQRKQNLRFNLSNFKPKGNQQSQIKEPISLTQKLRNAVHQINTVRKLSKGLDVLNFKRQQITQLTLNEIQTSVPKNSDKIMELLNSKDRALLDLMIINQRIVQNESQIIDFTQQFEVLREFRIYKPNFNASQQALSKPQSTYGMIQKWMKYMFYPWNFLMKYKQGESDQFDGQSIKKKNKKSKSRPTQKIKERQQDLRKSKAFTSQIRSQ